MRLRLLSFQFFEIIFFPVEDDGVKVTFNIPETVFGAALVYYAKGIVIQDHFHDFFRCRSLSQPAVFVIGQFDERARRADAPPVEQVPVLKPDRICQITAGKYILWCRIGQEGFPVFRKGYGNMKKVISPGFINNCLR